MPLPLANLDCRRWSDLVDEGVAQVPRYAPSWTDHNLHDPGRTFLELFAWLTEMALYRLNLVPPRHRRKFLALLGYHAHAARPARTVLSFSPSAAPNPFEIPAGVAFVAEGQDGNPLLFLTTRALTLSSAALAAVQVDFGDGVIRDLTADWRDGLPIAIFGDVPKAGAMLYLGFSNLPVQQPVALEFSFLGPGNDTVERKRILRELREQKENCRRVLPDIHCEGEPKLPPSVPMQVPTHHSVQVVWETFTGAADPSWQALERITTPARPLPGQVMDDTRSFTLDGLVEANFPPAIATTSMTLNGPALFYVRCRLVSGEYDASPVLAELAPHSVAAVQGSPIWKRFPIRVGTVPVGAPPAPGNRVQLNLQTDDFGVVQALTFLPSGTTGAPEFMLLNFANPGPNPGELSVEFVRVGVGTGFPLKSMTLRDAPILEHTLHVYTHSGSTWQEWTRRDDFDASTRVDSHFTADVTTGTLRFGDGERGRVPEPGAQIFACYRTTRAGAGNIPRGATIKLADTLRNQTLLASLLAFEKSQLANVKLFDPATGGAPEEELAHTTGRAVESLHAHDRLLNLAQEEKSNTLDQIPQEKVLALPAPSNAVNLLDLERLALNVPGTRVARAFACASWHPDFPCLQAAGVVTVVIIPALRVPTPRPSEGLLRAVKTYLHRRRMVCTRLEVVGASYLTVRVITQVKAEVGVQTARLRLGIIEALNAFLDPHVGGPRQLGWPFGRSVFHAEIMQVIQAVPGVDHVLSLSLQAENGESRCGDLMICPMWLVAPGHHEIEVKR